MKNYLHVLLFAAISLVSSHAADEKPNVILILSDDQGFMDYGFMGNKIAKTSNLDKMASESLLYTRGYVMPVCSPSLASLITGQLPHVHGITGNDLSKATNKPKTTGAQKAREPLAHQLLSNPMILPKVLTDSGYLTYQTGKLWNVTATEVGFTAGMTNKEGRHGGDGLDIGRKTMQPMFDFIEYAQTEKKPFFVWYAPMMPHDPHNPPQEILSNYQNKGLSDKAAKYYAMVEWFDKTCGQIDEFLTKRDLTDNTVIIYLADNGWDAEEGNRAKLSPYELGIRTPMFVRWPGKVKPQRDEETLASIIDFVPTVLNACSIKVPADLPGINLLDHAAMTKRDSIFVEAYTHDIADLGKPEKSLVTRVIIKGWSKLLLPGSQKLDKGFSSAPATPELFDLKSDPLEKFNLAGQRPEEVGKLTSLQNSAWSAKNP